MSCRRISRPAIIGGAFLPAESERVLVLQRDKWNDERTGEAPARSRGDCRSGVALPDICQGHRQGHGALTGVASVACARRIRRRWCIHATGGNARGWNERGEAGCRTPERTVAGQAFRATIGVKQQLLRDAHLAPLIVGSPRTGERVPWIRCTCAPMSYAERGGCESSQANAPLGVHSGPASNPPRRVRRTGA